MKLNICFKLLFIYILWSECDMFKFELCCVHLILRNLMCNQDFNSFFLYICEVYFCSCFEDFFCCMCLKCVVKIKTINEVLNPLSDFFFFTFEVFDFLSLKNKDLLKICVLLFVIKRFFFILSYNESLFVIIVEHGLNATANRYFYQLL